MPGYLREIKTTAVAALQQAFIIAYPETDPNGGNQPVYVSIEYPVNPAAIPAVWVEYEASDLRTVGVAYTEPDTTGSPMARWRFQGHLSFTIAAMSSNERDLIYDELVAMIAFASQSQGPSTFRQVVEASTLVATTWSYDIVEARGEAAAPGTPWGTDEVIYERGIAIQVVGEFVSEPQTMQLVNLSDIQVVATLEGYPDVSSRIDVTHNAP
jgi:hypothetical protein